MKKLFSLLLLCMLAITGRAAIYVDEITPSNLSGLSTTDQNFTVTGGQSGVEYKIIAKKGVYNGIAFSNSSGLFTAPIPDLYVKKIEIEYTSARPSQTINVYGKNVAYINLDDVFTPDEQRRGINLGTLNSSTSYLNVSGNYKYFAFAPTGDFEVSKIIVTWEGEGSDVVDVVFPNEFSGLNGQSYAVSSLTKNSGATYTICALETPGSDFFTINDGATTGGKYRGLICNNPPGKLKSLDIVCMATSSSGVLVLRGNSSNYDSSMSSAITGGTVIEEYLNLTTGTPSAKVSTFTDSQDYAAYSLVSSKAPKQIYKMTFKWEITDLSIPSAPMFSPAAGAFSTEQIVTLSAETGAVIKYSFVNNTDFSTWSTYTGPITVDQTKTIYAVAIKDGNVSSVASAEYIIGGAIPPAAPTFNPTSCSFVGSQSVEINCATEDASIEYSFDGSTWSEYSTALTITDTKTIYARATHNGDVSAVASATYTKIVPPAAPTFSVAGGTYNEVQTVAIACATEGASVEYSFDNTNWTTYTEALTISETKTLYARAAKDGLTTDATPQTYTIILPPAEPTFSPAGGMYSEPQTVSISAVDGAVVKYSFSSNSYDPEDDSWVTYTSPLTVSESKTIYAVAIKDGLVSGLVSANYVIVRDYTFDYRTYGYDNQTIIENKTDSDNRFFINICEGSEPKYSTPSPQHVKLYSGNKIEIASKPGYVITKIEFGLVSQNKMNSENTAVTKGVRSYDSNTFSITSNDTNPNLSGVVVENISSSQTRFTTIKIYYDVVDVDIEVPIFSVEAGNVDKGSSLSISSEAGTTLKYTINGGETQTASGNSVDIPFDAVGEKTIRAWAEAVVNGETKSSAVVEKTYNVQEYIPTGEIFTKVTSATQLQHGDKIIIVGKGYNVAMKKDGINTNNISPTQITINQNQIEVDDYTNNDNPTGNDLALVLELEKNTSTGYWMFKLVNYNGGNANKSYYLTAPNAFGTTDSNHLKICDEKGRNDNSDASITFNEDGDAIITFAPSHTTDPNRNTLKYNNSSNSRLFSCYLASAKQNAVEIYRLPGTATVPGIASLDYESGTVVNGTEVTATAAGATSYIFRFVPDDNDDDEQVVASTTGKFIITQSGTIYVKGVNGVGDGAESIGCHFSVAVPELVVAVTGEREYTTTGDNFVVKGTQVTFSSVGADEYTYAVEAVGEEDVIEDSTSPVTLTIMKDCTVTIQSSNSSGFSTEAEYKFKLVVPEVPIFSVNNTPIDFTDDVATVNFGANVTIAAQNADAIRYTVYPYVENFDINNPGTPIQATKTVESASTTYKIEGDVIIVASGLAGGVEGAEVVGKFLYTRAKISAPIFDVPGGIYIGQQGRDPKVLHLNAVQGAKIYYYTSLDADAPTFKLWDADMVANGITLDRSMTVYAYAELNGNVSEVVSNDYTIRSAIESLAATVDGELSPAAFGIAGNSSYISGAYVSPYTQVPYSYMATDKGGYLQMNFDRNGGIVSTFHTEAYVGDIWFCNHPTEGKNVKVNVYGSNNAYTSVDDLYDPAKRGTLIGQISFDDYYNSLSDEEKDVFDNLSDDVKWIKIPRLGDTDAFRYKYVGFCITSGTLYTNFKVEWDPIQYNVGSNVYTFVDENGVAYPQVNITDADYDPTIANQVVVIPSIACPEYMVPYGARLHITADNASHIRYSYTEDIADAVNSAETATNSTIEVPMTESHYVFAQGLIIGGERGTILGTNTRDFIRVRVEPAATAEFFPEPGLYRAGTTITGTVPNATGGTYKLKVGNTWSSEMPIDENGQFSFTLDGGTDIHIEATNGDTEDVNGGSVVMNFDGDDNGYPEVTTFYHLADEDDVPSTPIANIKGGTAVKKGTTLSVLVDGAIYVRYLVAPVGTTHDQAHEVIANWSTVQPEGFSYNLAAPEGFIEGVTDLSTIDPSNYVETFDYTIEDDCVIFAVGFNTSNKTNKEGKVGESDHNFGSYTIIRPQPVSFSYPAGEINMGSQVRMLSPGADEIYYEIIYLDDDGNPVSDTPVTRTVSGDIASIRIEQPVKISAWGVVSGARSLDVAEATYAIAHDKVFEQIFDITSLKDGDQVIFGAFDIDNDRLDERTNPIRSFAMSNTLYNFNVPGTPVLIEDGKINKPSDDVLVLNTEVNNDGTYSFYVITDLNGKMYLTAKPKNSDNEGTGLVFKVPDETKDKHIFNIEIKGEDYVNTGGVKDIYYAGDAIINAVNNTTYKDIAFNHESSNTIFNNYNPNSFGVNYSGIEIYVLNPNVEVYPPVTPVFDPEIGGSYPQDTEITIFSAGASTLYYFFAPEGVVPDETTIYNYVSGDRVTLELTMPGTYYAYGSNSAGITETVSNYYTIAEPGAPVFIPDQDKYEETDRLVDVGTKVTISCDDVTYLAYTITDKATGDVIESDVIEGAGNGQETTYDVYVMVDCTITAEGILGNSDAKVSSTEFFVNIGEDRVYHRISSTDELVLGEKYIIAAVSSTGSGSSEVFSGHAMGTITGVSSHLDSYEINEGISRRNSVVEIKNPSVFINEFELVATGDEAYPYALLFTDEARGVSRYLGLKALDSKLEMALTDPNSFAGVIPDNYTTSIAIDASENATIKFGEVDSKSASLKYNSTADRFKAYFSGSAIQIYKRVYVPAKPSFEPNGGYYNIGDDPIEVTITSKYAEEIYFTIYDNNNDEIDEGTISTNDDGCITVTIPSPEVSNSYYILAEGHRETIYGDLGESAKYEFGNAETYILIDNDEQIDRSYNYENPTPGDVQYIIAYNHSGNTSAVRAMAGVRADGSGIAAYNANIAEDVVSVPFTDTQIMRINLFYNGAEPNTYAFEDSRLSNNDNKWYLVFEDETGKLTKLVDKHSYHITIDSNNNSALKLKLTDNYTPEYAEDDMFVAYYVPGGYFLAATEEMIEQSADYEWPQLFRTNLYRLVQPRVKSNKDSNNASGSYAIGQRHIAMSNKAAVLDDFNTEKEASYADAVAAGITYRYTMDGSMPTMDSPELGDGFVFSPGFNDDGTLQELTMKLRIMAFNNDPTVKHSKSSVLQTYTSGIHVANIAEFKEHADDKEHLYVIDGDLGIAFDGVSGGKRELIVYDNSDEYNTGNYGFNYLVVQMPADEGAEDGGDMVGDGANNAWKGMHGYHADFDHIDLMSLGVDEAQDKYLEKLAKKDAEAIRSQDAQDVDHTDGFYHVKIETMVVDEDANGVLTAKRYSLYPNTNPDLDYLFNGEVVLANRYAKAGADEIYDNVEGYVFGREHPVFFVTSATPRTYKLLEPDLYIFNRGAIGNEVAGGSFLEDKFNPDEGFTMTVDTPIGFNYIADGFPYDPDYMDIFYSKDGTDVTIDNIISMGWKDETSLVGTESTKEYTLDWGDGETHTYTDYDYEQTPITTLPDADCGIMRYKGPFYVTTKGWTHTGGSSAFNKVQIKAVCILHPLNAHKAHKWTPALETSVDIWDVDYAPASGNGQQSVRRRILESGVYKTAMSPQKTVNSGITTSVDRVSLDDNTGDAIYFNLQGVRMPSSNLQRGFYIKVCGASASKVFVK